MNPALWAAKTGLDAQQTRMTVTSHNLANVNTNGFKKLSVEEFERGWSGTCLVFSPGQDMAQVAASRSPWVRFARYLVPYKKILVHLFLATFVIQMLGIVPPVIIQNILDGVIVHQNVNLLHLLIVGLII